jgi:hypothetical protein
MFPDLFFVKLLRELQGRENTRGRNIVQNVRPGGLLDRSAAV